MNSDTGEYPVEVIRKPIRSVRVRVMPNGTVRVTAPDGFDIPAFLAEKKDWIDARQRDMNLLAEEHNTAPDRMLLLGTEYSVCKGNRCQTDHQNQIITAPHPRALRRHLTDDFRALITKSVSSHAREMGVSPGRCSVRMQKTRWGSCSSAGNLSFNLKLYALPIHLRDYVVVHELTHLSIMNHSPAFWSAVGAYYPAYNTAEADLRTYWVGIERSHWWNAIRKG